MKKIYYILSLGLATGLFASCSSDVNGTGEIIPEDVPTLNDTRAFPEDDGAIALNGQPADKFWTLLQGADTAMATTFAKYEEMSRGQYNEIKEFTDELVASATTENRKYRLIFNWVKNNVKYTDGVSQEPYNVFINKQAVCQGYSNLLNVMLRTQGIHVINVNGYLINYGNSMGHAWNYVKSGGVWRLADATNNIEYIASETSKYNQQFIPMFADGYIIENDNYACEYTHEKLNLSTVKMAENAFVVPFSVTLNNGTKVQVSSFSPTSDIPANVTEIYIGKNITSLGQDGICGLKDHAPNVEAAHVDPENQALLSYEGAVYYNNEWSQEPVYIPSAMKTFVLKPCETVGKNYVCNHPGIETIHFLEGTKTIEAWAVEKCPNLKVAYVPVDVEIDEQAFEGVHPDFQIIRQDQTGIKDVIAD